jgi:hypothetical protein
MKGKFFEVISTNKLIVIKLSSISSVFCELIVFLQKKYGQFKKREGRAH